ncbi:hypothetical protein [Haloferula sargassicola]|uniref:Uncharacterized protein n=1 Tax=Haloferula sargassicola TaxID=490096 RepID=A0ABP9URC3_9BACT
MSEERSEHFWGCLPIRGTLYLAAIWIGSSIAYISLVPGLLVAHQRIGTDFLLVGLFAPVLWMNESICLNGFILLPVLFLFHHLDEVGPKLWTTLAIFEAVVTFVGWCHEIHTWPGVYVASGCFVLSLGMFVTAVWWFRRWRWQKYGQELLILHSEHAQRRADLQIDVPGPEE